MGLLALDSPKRMLSASPGQNETQRLLCEYGICTLHKKTIMLFATDSLFLKKSVKHAVGHIAHRPSKVSSLVLAG